MLQLSRPSTKRELHHIIGSFAYYRRILPYLGYFMAPLHAMSGANSKLEWTKAHEKNFKLMKKEVAKVPLVFQPDFSEPMHIFTDAAAGSGCSYHISQYHQQKDVYLPLAWGSHKISATEASYSQVVAELYGIIYALADNPYFLQWSRVFVHTDAKPLSYLLKFKTKLI